MRADESIDAIKNIGRTRAGQFKKIGVETVGDIVEYYPRDYEDRSTYVDLDSVEEGSVNTVRGKVCAPPQGRRAGKLTIVSVLIKDKTGQIECVWFNKPYVKNQLTVGREYSFTGRVKNNYGRVQIESPDYEPVSDDSLNTGRIVPVYTVPGKISQKVIRGCIKEALYD